MNAKVVTAVGVVVALILMMTGCDPGSRQEEVRFETTFGKALDYELFLPAPASPELRREVDYWPQTRISKSITVFYRAGGKVEKTYWKDGKLRTLTERYPLEGGSLPLSLQANSLEGLVDVEPSSGARRVDDVPTDFGPVRRAFEFLDDGRVLHAGTFRPDGTAIARGTRLADGSFEQVDFNKDGRTVEAQKRFSNEGELVFARVMTGDKIRSLTRRLSSNFEETISFRDDGTRNSRTVRNLETKYEEIEFFKPDGEAIRLVVYRTRKIEALYFKDDGTVDHLRSFEGDGGMTVIKYRDNAGKVKPTSENGRSPKESYRQTWRADHDQKGESRYILDRLEELDAHGYVARRFAFSLNSGKLFKIDYVDSDNMSTKVLILRSDMTVERIDNYERFGDSRIPSIRSVEVAPEKKMHDSFDEKMFQQLPYEDVRKLVGAPIVPPPQPEIDDEEWLD